jgi:hypothetical protein
VLLQVTLKVTGNLLLQRCGTVVAECADGDLIDLPPFGIDEDFYVTGSAIPQQHTRDREFRGGFARGFGSNLCDGANGKTLLNNHEGLIGLVAANRWVNNVAQGIVTRRNLYMRSAGRSDRCDSRIYTHVTLRLGLFARRGVMAMIAVD